MIVSVAWHHRAVTAKPPAPYLDNAWVALEQIGAQHADALVAAMGDPAESVRWLPSWRAGGTMADTVAAFVDDNDRGRSMTWVIRRRADDMIVGSTSFMDIEPVHRSLEVGATWIGRWWWRTEVNTATKLLVLGHAFDDLAIERVTLKTDHLNVRSQRAIERLGAVREGALRRHRQRPDGTWRDSVYYSILREEWPIVRDRLTTALSRALR